MENPKISVVMSVYNGEKYLREAIESILNQTFKDFEFVIVDDRSTDKTSEIINEYFQKDNRIKVIKNDRNMGLTRSLNKAINQSSGNYIARMDADDIAIKERLEKQVDFMERNPDVVLLGTAFYEIDEYGKELSRKFFPTTDRDIRKILIKYNPFCHASVVMRHSAFDKIGLYDESILKTQDYDLWFRLASVGKVANLSEILMKRRYDDNNISIAQENEQLKWAVRVRKNTIKKGHYSIANYLHLIRPSIALVTPFFLRKIIRKYILKNKMYGWI
jgi:glycosyltransferase involved in cell wall biosynthesis